MTSVVVSDVASSDVAVDSFVKLPTLILDSVVWSSTIYTVDRAIVISVVL